MSLLLTRQDDSPIDGFDLTVERGLDSAIIDVKIFNDGSEDVVGAFLVLYAETTPGSGVYASSGSPVTNERMGRFQITGQNSDETPGQQVILGVVQPMGHLAVAQFPKILPGDWILANVWLTQGGASAGGGSVRVKLEVADDASAEPLPAGVSAVGTGIDSGRKQPATFHVQGGAVTASGSPDDTVHVGTGSWVVQGEEYVDAVIEDATFDQDDDNADTLGVGEAYVAVLTRTTTTTPTVTKGIKAIAVDAVKPTPPAGELLIAWVTVLYNAGGTTISPSDIEDARIFGRYLVAAPPTGLTVVVFPGSAVIDSFRQVNHVLQSITLLPSAVNRVWLEWTGEVTTSTSDVPPSAGAVKLAIATTDGSNVISLEDTRTYVRPIEPAPLDLLRLGPSDRAVAGGLVNGGSWSIKTFSEIVATAATPTDTVANLLPADAIILGVTWRVREALSGSLTTFEIGVAADTDRFGTAQAKTLGATGTSAANGVSGQAAAAPVRITSTSGTLTDGEIEVVVYAMVFTPPTS